MEWDEADRCRDDVGGGQADDLAGASSGRRAQPQSLPKRPDTRSGGDAGGCSTLGATSCLGQVRHFDQSGTNILNKEILFEKSPKNLRQRIFRASRTGDLHRVRSLQRLMLKNRANALESVRRVTQVNRGKSTPGIDHVVVTTPEERGALCHQLSALDLHKVHPVRRVYIPKRKGRRPLGIPMLCS